jgi:hypothetical protein
MNDNIKKLTPTISAFYKSKRAVMRRQLNTGYRNLFISKIVVINAPLILF